MTNFWKTLKTPITILAPMSDVTDYVFREIITEIAKPDVFFTEFVSIDALFSKGSTVMERKLKFSQEQKPIVAQVWGTDLYLYARAAKHIKNLGFDGIDINMGCPDRAVMKKKSGAALINQHELVSSIVASIRAEAPNIALSIKTRLAKTELKTKEWVSFLLSLDIDALTIHGREASQMSKGNADWNEIKKAVKLKDGINPSITVIGNGDVKSYREVIEKYQHFGVDGVMIGRGIFQNPWVFEKNINATPHTVNDYINLLLKHTRLFHTTWGKTKNFEIMKKFFKIYVKDFEGANEFRQRLMEVKTYDEFEIQVDELLN